MARRFATGSHRQVPALLAPVQALARTDETILGLETLPATLAVIGPGPLDL